ncbi:MAG: M15 family metallopeptidase [Clostridia bacterium]|nr:M15 family metallopeptidase [Clostridia bacterium]
MADNNNIDLLEPLNLDIDEIPQVQRKRKVDVPSKKEMRLREIQAMRFLCFMLAFVVVFVAVVCVFANRNNKEYLAQKELEAAQNAQELNEIDVTATVASVTQASKQESAGAIVKITTTEPVSTTEATTLPVISSTAPQSNVGAVSLDNPTIITDLSFSTAVVNRNYRIPSSYEADLVYVCGSDERLQREVAAQYEAMYNAGKADGVTLTPCSGYRSYGTQETLYNRKFDLFTSQGYSYDEARVQAATIVMIPGSSEHNLGYAMDIVCVEEWFETTDEFKWLMENAADYGFILRYPKDKQDITKVIYEPWHWRYVGVETAKAIKASGLVMEEYYGKSAQ